ncbi:hypothetical protein YH66_05320 [[Brevibacterium] flavum]|uniref:Uncharacterized protein n=1 Tax=[Brevibacterium] flavum TaxID=92706 RepID=A0A0F6Z5B8_9CORY|nr:MULTISPECIES: hypothetical protein [Corynebacterium]AKF27015.1 hypothetical protein YH66_05320 [[Brevibacterium] flavum]AST20255.1 hypothetical protein CEY17_05375 [Corynebacterium glutamicum ATCC 14067]KEI22732.1 hypothetical protein KIQ_009165 [Corynebacterium glutamicum ATCC 14067]OKX92994.1 hypothetical protein AUP71_11030 [Corynebacterium glutamicum]QJS15396.1 hypothetical protein HK412_03370 [Corynebacterium glutamicum]
MITRIYPYTMPTNTDPWAGLLINAGNRIRLDAEGLNILAQHLRDVGFIHNGDQETLHPITLAVGITTPDATINISPGDTINWKIPGAETSSTWIDGDAPTTLEIKDGHLQGQCSILGEWRFTIVVGPKIMYQSTYAGSPLEPGEWVPITQPRTDTPNTHNPTTINLTGLTPDELDNVIAAAQQAKATNP